MCICNLEPHFIVTLFNGDNIVNVSCSGSTIVGIGSPDPPAFVYDDDDYKDVFVSGMLPVAFHKIYVCHLYTAKTLS